MARRLRCAFRPSLLGSVLGPYDPASDIHSVHSRRALGCGGGVEPRRWGRRSAARLRPVSDAQPSGGPLGHAPGSSKTRANQASEDQKRLPEPSVSRILFPPPVALGRATIIYLAATIARRDRATYPEASDGPPSSASLFGLAPCGVYPASDVTTRAVRSYRTFSPLPPH